MRSLAALTLTVFALASVPALAQDAMAEKNALKFIDAADANGDGAVDYHEHDAWLREGGGLAIQGSKSDAGSPRGGVTSWISSWFTGGEGRTDAEFDPRSIVVEDYNKRVAAFAGADKDANGMVDATEAINWPDDDCSPYAGCGQP